jgi:hypothetical protein
MVVFLVNSHALPNQPAAFIEKYQGSVNLHENSQKKGALVTQEKTPLYVKDILSTRGNANAFLQLSDGSQVILQENSAIRIEGVETMKVDKGKVLFKIKKRKKNQKKFKVSTDLAIIGVRGTEFLVEEKNGRFDVYLKHGELHIQSLKQQFIRYQTNQQEAFDQFKNKQKNEFDAFKQKRNKQSKHYVNEVTLTANRAISISGREVIDLPIPDEINKMFELFNQFGFPDPLKLLKFNIGAE